MDQSFFRCKKVLVIDDCAPVRATVKGMLQQMGFEAIHVAKDAGEAMQKCIDMPFDFILCDFNLGDCKDGYQLFEALKKQQLLQRNPECLMPVKPVFVRSVLLLPKK